MYVNVKHKIVASKNFVSKHRVAIAVTLTAALAVKWQMNSTAQFNEFLAKHNLLDEYYATFEDVV